MYFIVSSSIFCHIHGQRFLSVTCCGQDFLLHIIGLQVYMHDKNLKCQLCLWVLGSKCSLSSLYTSHLHMFLLITFDTNAVTYCERCPKNIRHEMATSAFCHLQRNIKLKLSSRKDFSLKNGSQICSGLKLAMSSLKCGTRYVVGIYT